MQKRKIRETPKCSRIFLRLRNARSSWFLKTVLKRTEHSKSLFFVFNFLFDRDAGGSQHLIDWQSNSHFVESSSAYSSNKFLAISCSLPIQISLKGCMKSAAGGMSSARKGCMESTRSVVCNQADEYNARLRVMPYATSSQLHTMRKRIGYIPSLLRRLE